MIETISLIVAGLLSGVAAFKADRAHKQTTPNGSSRTLVDLYEDLDTKLDSIVEWQVAHEARHTYLHPQDPWRVRTTDEFPTGHNGQG